LALSQSDPFGYESKKTNNYKINMKTITLITLFVGALAFITNAYASVSTNVGIATDYLWRGGSASGGEAVVFGGMDYAGEGYYAGIWTSSCGDAVVENAAGAEVPTGHETDFYIGTDINGFDVGYIRYEYAGEGDFEEYYVGYTYQGFDLFYAVDVDNSDSDFFSVSYGLPTVVEGVDASLTYGDHGDSDYLQLDLSVGDVVLSVVDTDADGTVTALSYSLPL
jgi:uncharacterized protein (TIGR02001 family)